jgi:hypothetical protein
MSGYLCKLLHSTKLQAYVQCIADLNSDNVASLMLCAVIPAGINIKAAEACLGSSPREKKRTPLAQGLATGLESILIWPHLRMKFLLLVAYTHVSNHSVMSRANCNARSPDKCPPQSALWPSNSIVSGHNDHPYILPEACTGSVHGCISTALLCYYSLFNLPSLLCGLWYM